MGLSGFVAQIDLRPRFPLPRTDLFYGNGSRYAKSSVAVENGSANLNLRDLSVEVTRHEALAQKFHAKHFGLDAASAVVSAPPSPESPTQVLARSHCFVSGDGTG